MDILDKSLAEIGFGQQFVEQSRQMGFLTLADILRTSPDILTGCKGFSYHWLSELSQYLGQRGLLHLLQPIPGKNHDRSGGPSAENSP
jgi:hypothetical protein